MHLGLSLRAVLKFDKRSNKARAAHERMCKHAPNMYAVDASLQIHMHHKVNAWTKRDRSSIGQLLVAHEKRHIPTDIAHCTVQRTWLPVHGKKSLPLSDAHHVVCHRKGKRMNPDEKKRDAQNRSDTNKRALPSRLGYTEARVLLHMALSIFSFSLSLSLFK